MNKGWLNNFIIMITLGLSSFTLSYGDIEYINESRSGWPIYAQSVYNTDSKKAHQDNNIINKKLNTDKINNDEKLQDILSDLQINLLEDNLSERELQITNLETRLVDSRLQIKQLKDEIEEKRQAYYILFGFLSIISIAFILLICYLLLRRQFKIYNKDDCVFGKPDISVIENLLKESNSLKKDFTNIQQKSNLTIFAKLDLLKDDFYNELNKVDWKKNKNRLLVEKYQLIVNYYAEEMHSELKKIHDEFEKIVTENVDQIIDKIETIKKA